MGAKLCVSVLILLCYSGAPSLPPIPIPRPVRPSAYFKRILKEGAAGGGGGTAAENAHAAEIESSINTLRSYGRYSDDDLQLAWYIALSHRHLFNSMT